MDGERRRQLLVAALGSAGLPLVGCGDDETNPTPTEEVIAIVGGGIAGLHCAYRLKEAGVIATVYEAAKRVGGRMYSAVGEFAEAPEQLLELGGELIDTGHETLKALAQEFGLVLDDRLAGDQAPLQQDTWYIGGVVIPDEVVVEQFSAVAPAIAAQVEAADSDDAAYTTLDETPLDQWLDENVPPAQYPELHAILSTAYRGEYGLENNQQSALNLIYLIGADDPDPFRTFGDSDERFHTHTGNEAFTIKLAESVGTAQIKLEHELVSVADADGGAFELTFNSPDGEVKVTATRVVFALPFTKLREVDLTGLSSLSAEKKTIIDELGYGTNAKVMMGFTSRVWKADYQASGGMGTDLPVQQTWDTTIGQDGAHGIMTNFLGGEQGLASGEGTAEDWAAGVLPDLEQIWPGMDAAWTKKAVRMHWPTVPTMKGSYACYKPGQWAFFGLEGQREGNLHFCGEHTSLDFQGYMEGGAETGAFVAAEILEDLETAQPAGLVTALGIKLLLPQAGYRAKSFPRENPFQRRRRIRQIARDLLQKLEKDG